MITKTFLKYLFYFEHQNHVMLFKVLVKTKLCGEEHQYKKPYSFLKSQAYKTKN